MNARAVTPIGAVGVAVTVFAVLVRELLPCEDTGRLSLETTW